jgi:hypothetical protein
MKTLKKIATLFITLQLVFAVVGFSVYYHICSCKNTITASVLVEESCCDHHKPVANSCCENESKSETPSCHNKSEKDCKCKTEVKVLGIDNSFTPSYTFVNFQPIGVDTNIDINSSDSEPIINNISLYQFTVEPPPKWGKALVISHCSLKIPVHIS